MWPPVYLPWAVTFESERLRCELKIYLLKKKPKKTPQGRVETSTDFATQVSDTNYPTGTRVFVTVNLVSD